MSSSHISSSGSDSSAPLAPGYTAHACVLIMEMQAMGMA